MFFVRYWPKALPNLVPLQHNGFPVCKSSFRISSFCKFSQVLFESFLQKAFPLSPAVVRERLNLISTPNLESLSFPDTKFFLRCPARLKGWRITQFPYFRTTLGVDLRQVWSGFATRARQGRGFSSAQPFFMCYMFFGAHVVVAKFNNPFCVVLSDRLIFRYGAIKWSVTTRSEFVRFRE